MAGEGNLRLEDINEEQPDDGQAGRLNAEILWAVSHQPWSKVAEMFMNHREFEVPVTLLVRSNLFPNNAEMYVNEPGLEFSYPENQQPQRITIPWQQIRKIMIDNISRITIVTENEHQPIWLESVESLIQFLVKLKQLPNIQVDIERNRINITLT